MARRTKLALLAILCVYTALFVRAVTYELVWDDIHEIAESPDYDAPLLDGALETQTARNDASLVETAKLQQDYDSFRPLTFASFWLEIRAWGRSPAPLHATNLVLGALCTLLVFCLARRWVSDVAALCVTALFAIHPMQVEAVVYVSARGDLLAALGALLCLAAVARANEASARSSIVGWTAAAAVAFAASVLAKESFACLPILVGVWLLLEGRLRGRWPVAVVLAAIAIGYLVVRSAVVHNTAGSVVASAALALPGICVEYLRSFIAPFGLSTEHLHASALTPIGIVLGAAALGGAAVAAWRRRSRELIAAVFGLCWVAILVAPSCVPIVSSSVRADRYFYLPFAGLAVAIVAIVARLLDARPRIRRPAFAIAGIWLVVLLFISWRQVAVWRTNETLYVNAVTMTPESSMANYRIGYLYATHDQWAEAAAYFESAIARDPDNALALNNLGVMFMRQGDYRSAVAPLARATRANPGHFRAWLNLALSELQLGEHEQGCAHIQRALAINPGYTTARAEWQQRCAR